MGVTGIFSSFLKIFLMRKIQISILLSAFSLIVMFNVDNVAVAQTIDQRRNNIQVALDNPKAVIPSYLFDSLAGLYQDGVSGNQVKDGKYLGTSLTVDDKSATVNLGIKYFNLSPLDIYSSFQIAGTASDKFVDIIKEGKYQQTITGGGVFNIFFRGFRGWADCYEKMLLHKRVDRFNRIYNLRGNDLPAIMTSRVVADSLATVQHHYLDSMVGDLLVYQEACRAYVRNHPGENKECGTSPGDDNYDYPGLEDKGNKAIDTLKKLGVISQDFYIDDELGKDLRGLRNSYLIGSNYLRQTKFVRESESIYMSAPWSNFILQWFTLGASYNISPQPIIDSGLSGGEHYIYTYNSEYAKFSLAYNLMWVNFNRKVPFQLTISPTFIISNPRKFADEDKFKFSKLTPFVLQPGDTTLKTEYSYIIADLRSMGVLAAGLVVLLVVLAQVLPS